MTAMIDTVAVSETGNLLCVASRDNGVGFFCFLLYIMIDAFVCLIDWRLISVIGCIGGLLGLWEERRR